MDNAGGSGFQSRYYEVYAALLTKYTHLYAITECWQKYSMFMETSFSNFFESAQLPGTTRLPKKYFRYGFSFLTFVSEAQFISSPNKMSDLERLPNTVKP